MDRQSNGHPTSPPALGEAEQVVEALNEAIALDGTAHEKSLHLLRRFAQLIGGDPDVELVLLTSSPGTPGLRVLERVWTGPTFERIEPRPHSAVQEIVDASGPAAESVMATILQNPRTPHTLLLSEVPAPGWFEQIRDRFLSQYRWTDAIIGNWAARQDRIVVLVLQQRKDQPTWGADARRLVSLMLRAIAPIVDREMFDGIAQEMPGPNRLLTGRDLSGRQTDVLHLLLRGMSEKEVARELGVSTHTVHTHVKKLYTEFNVSSRGELLALFVDQRVLKMTG